MTDSANEPVEMPLKRLLSTGDVPGDGRHVTIRLSDAERSALATFADCLSIESFLAEIDVKPWGKTGFRVIGRVTADVAQPCVVTLEPVSGRVDEAIDVRLAPVTEADRFKPATNEAGEIVVDLDDEIPDFFEGGSIDVGAIAAEFFVLGLDPYPRKPGVAFEPLPDPDKAEVSPFAKLAVLKRPDSAS